jgi:integrase
MSDRSHSAPSYRRHKASGQAIVTLPDGRGGRRDVLLGPYRTPESRAEYRRVIAEWAARGHRMPSGNLTVTELIAAFFEFAQGYYRKADGEPTNEVVEIKYALKPVRQLYGNIQAATFGPLALKAVRKVMVDAGWCRTRTNKQIGRIKRAFRWAVSEELIEPSVYQGLQSLPGLAKGRTEARESDPVKPVPEAFIQATLPYVSAPVRAMIELQRLTGMRPGEVCAMRGCDLDMSGTMTIYRPATHKNDWRGKDRAVCIGPRGQAILRPFLALDTQAYLFSPSAAETQREKAKREGRTTPMYPSHQRRYEKDKARRGRRPLSNRYTTSTYTKAVARACLKADVPHWHPNQLRHNHATEVRRQYGLEAAGAALGHAKMSATEIYAERDQALAQRVAAEIG